MKMSRSWNLFPANGNFQISNIRYYKHNIGEDSALGAELYKVTKDGDEILLAVYSKDYIRPDGKRGKFVRLEDMN